MPFTAVIPTPDGTPEGFLTLRLGDGEMTWITTSQDFTAATQSAEEEANADQDKDAIYVVLPILAIFAAKG